MGDKKKDLQSRTIRMYMKGATWDDNYVRLNEFTTQLEVLKNILRHIDRLVTNGGEPSVYYRIVDLSHSSPATVTIEARSVRPEDDLADKVVNKFFVGLKTIVETSEIPLGFDHLALEQYKGLCANLKKNMSEITIVNSKYSIRITEQLARHIDEVIGVDIIEEGTLDGKLETVNVHNRNVFYIYPVIGPKKVACTFPEIKFDDVKKAIRCYVNIKGKLRYKKRESFPYAIDVIDFEIYPPEEELPTLEDLRGIAPNATGNVDSVAFVRALRNEEKPA